MIIAIDATAARASNAITRSSGASLQSDARISGSSSCGGTSGAPANAAP